MRREIRGLSNIKTAQRCKIYAKPKLSGTEHLDLFLLQKNRDRLQQEIQCVQERLKRLKKDIQGIDEEITKITKSVHAPVVTSEGARNKELPRSMKKMELQY